MTINNQKIKEIVDLYNSGFSTTKIRNLVKVSHGSISKYLHLNNVKIRSLSEIYMGKFNPMYKKTPWNKGLTKEIDERVSKNVKDGAETRKRLYAEGKLKPPMLGKHHSDETKKKIKSKNIGKKHSDETKKKQSEAQQLRKKKYGYIHSPETRQKLSQKLKGRKFTKEWRAKISETRKKKYLSGEIRNWNY
ncbi:MAG: NUMOD3 domain-containing DNA-binding protein [Nanoarchaeota archaeon]